jgi:hypothetical protein
VGDGVPDTVTVTAVPCVGLMLVGEADTVTPGVVACANVTEVVPVAVE